MRKENRIDAPDPQFDASFAPRAAGYESVGCRAAPVQRP